jgi:amino acid adenylation domain-containing protein
MQQEEAQLFSIGSLSPVQQGMWIDQIRSSQAPYYHIGAIIRFDFEINQGLLARAIANVVKRHAALRMVFAETGGFPAQICLDEIASSFCVTTIELLEPTNTQEEIRAVIKREFLEPFKLYGAPLWSIKLFYVESEPNYLLLKFHHLITDGYGIKIAFNDIVHEYQSLSRDQEIEVPIRGSIQEYIERDLAYVDSERYKKELEFWCKRLSAIPSPLFRPRVTNNVTGWAAAGKYCWEVDLSLIDSIESYSATKNLSITHFLLTLIFVYFGRTTGRTDFVIGLRVHNRTGVGKKLIVGNFLSVLPLSVKLDLKTTFLDCMSNVAEELRRCYRYKQVSIIDINRKVGLHKQSREQLYDISLSIEEFHLESFCERSFQEVISLHSGFTQIPLSLFLRDYAKSGNPVFEFDYDLRFFNRADIEEIQSRFSLMIREVLRDIALPVFEIPLLTSSEEKRILVDFNATAAAYPQDRCIHELFEAQVDRSPDAIALVCGDAQVSYGELDRRANQLAHYLRGQGVRPDSLVGLCVDRSVDMVVGLLGILKSGGAYVPLDPDYPAERLKYMLEDAAPVALVTQRRFVTSLQSQLPSHTGVVVVDGEHGEGLLSSPQSRLSARELGLNASHLAYVIYTSGSTGRPKGVMVEHRNVVNFLESLRGRPGITPSDRWLAVTSISFDIAALEIYLPLINGALLVVAETTMGSDTEQLAEALGRHAITIFQCTPTSWRMLAMLDRSWPGLKALCGGEALATDLSRTLLERTGELWNLYGPTETTIWSSMRRVSLTEDMPTVVVSIGGPIANTQIYILDGYGAPVPVGVTGELYIGGAGVARGYLNREELTAERFLPDPFSSEPGARMYRTGDIGRWRADGNIEFLGRNDAQVKIRGYRIELGEIEARLAQHAAVREAVVVAREESGERRLVAYYTRVAGHESSVGELRAWLQARLPEYMVPGAYVALDELPLTPNGKLDRRALPSPELDAYLTRGYEAPEGEVEEILAGIWQELLKVERVGRHDNFFELGGHSLLAIAVVTKLKGVGMEVNLLMIFKHPQLKEFAKCVLGKQDAVRKSCHAVVLKNKGDKRPLFLVHEIIGEIFPLFDLAQQIEDDIPVYGLMLPAHSEFSSIEELAAWHVRTIREVQTAGPYRIAGHSLGGVLAYEIAVQLCGHGEQVEFVGLIDSYTSAIDVHTFSHAKRIPDDLTALDVLRLYVRFKNPYLEREHIELLQSEVDPGRAIELCRKLNLFSKEIGLQEMEGWAVNATMMNRIAYDYYPSSSALSVNLFTADEPSNDESRGWSGVVKGSLRIDKVDGTHHTMVQKPHVLKLGAMISLALKSATARTSHAKESVNADYAHCMKVGDPRIPPIFCFPGAGASITSFMNFSAAMNTGAGLYGLQPRGMNDGNVPFMSVEAAAKHYVNAIRAVSQNGPYRLVGHSFGGWIAFETALQLTAAGLPVDTVVLLDSDPPHLASEERRYGSRTDIFKSLICVLEQESGHSLNLAAETLAMKPYAEKLELLLRAMISVKLMPRKSSAEALHEIIKVFGVNANTRYTPTCKFEGRLLVVQAANRAEVADERTNNIQTLTTATENSMSAWTKYADRNVFRTVRANHMSILKPPCVVGLANVIADLWKEDAEYRLRGLTRMEISEYSTGWD